MIVIDSSIVGPMTLPDELPLSDETADAIATDQLIAPSHLPLELMNMLIMAERRGRIGRVARQGAVRDVQNLGIVLHQDTGDHAWRDTARLADLHGLTIYDAAYLELALRCDATLATRDTDLADAARVEHLRVID